MPVKQILNAEFYEEVIKRLIGRFHLVGHEFQECWSWYLLHDNALAHFLGVISEILTN
jgi:hypothetical protein